MGLLVSVEHAGLWGAEFGGFLCVSGACWDLESRVFGVSGGCFGVSGLWGLGFQCDQRMQGPKFFTFPSDPWILLGSWLHPQHYL